MPFLLSGKKKDRLNAPCGALDVPAGYVQPRDAAELLERFAKKETFPCLTLPQGTSLRNQNLAGLQAPGASLGGVDLTGAVLSLANLEKANLNGCSLTGADLSGACLREAQLREAVFHGDGKEQHTRPATLVDANLDSADIAGADFRHCDLRGANLYAVRAQDKAARFNGADLRSVKLGNAALSAAIFIGARLDGADLKDADLSLADYRQALGGVFDETRTERMAFTSTTRGFLLASPLWLQLRSAYTGVWMLVHLVLLTIFVLPHVGQAFIWRTGSALQEFARENLSDSALIPLTPRDKDSTLGGDMRRFRDSVRQEVAVQMKRALVDSGVPRGLCLDRAGADCRPQAIWQVMLGWNESWWIRVGLILAYFANLLRLVLTVAVTSQRDTEAMTGRSPSAGFCRLMGVGHWIFRVLVIYVAGSAAVSVVNFLQQPVWLRQ